MSKSSEAVNSFVASFIGSVAFYMVVSIVVGIYLFANINLAGGETLEEIESSAILKLVVSFLILSILFIYTRFWKKRNKYNIMGTLLIPSVCFVVSGYFVIRDKLDYSKFEQTVWIGSETKPEGMAKSLLKSKQLVGLSKQEITDMLGLSAPAYRDVQSVDAFYYDVQNDWILIVKFNNNKVSDVNLRQRMLLF